jgi:hypothetical protein
MPGDQSHPSYPAAGFPGIAQNSQNALTVGRSCKVSWTKAVGDNSLMCWHSGIGGNAQFDCANRSRSSVSNPAWPQVHQERFYAPPWPYDVALPGRKLLI